MSTAGDLAITALSGDAVIRIAPDATVLDVAKALISSDIGILAVGNVDGPVESVVSERDVVRAVAEGRDLAATRVGDVASTAVRWCDATATVAEVAAEMMEHWVRHLLIEDEGRLVGIVSARDLLGAYASGDGATDQVEV
jgi:CBS domain-containing protein